MASSQYSVAKHTIIPLIFKITHKNTLSYLIKDPTTSSLILLPSNQEPHSIKQHVLNIQKQFNCKLTHTFLHTNSQMQQIFNQKVIIPSTQGELKPELIGQISICFISASGYQKDFNIIAATHINPTSTKFPVLFSGRSLSVCSIDIQSTAKAQYYMDTLNKLKYFPNETYIFPEKKVELDDLQFAYALEKNAFVGQKIEQFKAKSKQFSDCLIPTSILEEKSMNPFLNPHKYASLLKANDKNACFQVLRRMRQQWRKA